MYVGILKLKDVIQYIFKKNLFNFALSQLSIFIWLQDIVWEMPE